jgi:hypothetical protein
MKIRLIDKQKPITAMWCFSNSGYDGGLIDNINSGKQVKVDRVPKPAWEYVEKIKIIKNSKGEE